MKILCIIDSLGSGGAQRQLVELGKGFKEEGHDVVFIIYHNINFFKSELEAANIPILLVEEPNYFKRILKIRVAIRKQKPNAVLSFLEGPNFIATVSGLSYRKWKLVVGERSANPEILNSIRLRLYRWCHLLVDYVVANSQANIELVKKASPLLQTNKCKVIYNFTNITAQDKKVNLSTHEKIIVTIPATYRNVKNTDGLIEGVRLLDVDYKNRLIVNWFGRKGIEDGVDYYKNVYKKVKEYNLQHVIFLNDVTLNINDEYQKSDFIALLSHYEGFPNVICEAMTLGKPVIASSVSDIPRIINEDENGFLCDSKKPESIRDAFKKAIDSSVADRKRIGANNIKKANIIFDKKKIINAYLKLLQ